MNTVNPTRSTRLKWLTLTLALLIFAAFFAIWKFTPLMKVDGQNVSFLGGLIEVNERSRQDDAPSVELEGTHFASSAELSGLHPVVRVSFANAKINFDTAPSTSLHWDCKVSIPKNHNQPTFHFDKDGSYAIDLASTGGAKCQISVPQGAVLKVSGANGKVQLVTPRFDADVALTNGDIKFKPTATASYDVKTDVTNGKVDAFPAAHGEKPYKLNLSVTNGRVLNAR